ncbi:MAG: 1-deoxy-D-xylulose-5-phosphate synthase [Succinivibrionaceae bacterium]
MSDKVDTPLLDKIKSPADIRDLSIPELKVLAEELRVFLINSVSKNGGHLASGLGVVELTIALHYVYDTPNDYLIWDVGHQAYPHKILTGRKDLMGTIRQLGGLHPFLWRDESEYDVFSTGHASTSISEALGLAVANRQLNNNKKVVAVIGDGALSGGVAFEAMNQAGDIKEDMLIILNDNEMSISENVGSLSKHLAMLLSSPTYANFVKSGTDVLDKFPIIKNLALKTQEHIKGMVVPGTLFEEFGFNYVGPIDGHDIESLINVLRNMKQLKGPQFLHVATVKGKGYQPAEDNPTKYHGVSKFNPDIGLSTTSSKNNEISYSALFGKWLEYKAPKEKELVAITPAMGQGSGMVDFANHYPDRFFDVAIAEQHSVLFASGLARGGLHPYVCVYSTFLQRAYDQLVHDVAIQDLPIVIAIDRAGIVGQDGPTHQGVLDISFIRSIPNIAMFAPSCLKDMWNMFNFASTYPHPITIRYPRGNGIKDGLEFNDDVMPLGKAKVLKEGSQIAILVWGPLVNDVFDQVNSLSRPYTVVDMCSIKPFDRDCLIKLSENHKYFVTLEDGVIVGGIGEEISRFVNLENLNVRVLNLGFPDEFIEQGLPEEIYDNYGLSGKKVVEYCDGLLSASVDNNGVQSGFLKDKRSFFSFFNKEK